MLTGQDIVCFANDWDGDPLSKKHIMTRLARQNRVLWINSLGCRNPTATARDVSRALKKAREALNGCRQVADNIWVHSPLAVPFHGRAAARLLNRYWLRASLRSACRRLGMHAPITWSFLPSSAGVAGALHERLVVYHCVDEFSRFTGTDAAAIEALEARLMARADLVFVSSAALQRAKGRMHARTFHVAHGVDVAHFRAALDAATEIPADMPRGEGPVIGFFGLIADWVDLDLVRSLALARPHWRFVLIGKADTDVSLLANLENVRLLGRKSYTELPAYAKGFDVAILPFRINELTWAANPLKIREYLAAGLPVVATDIPEVRGIPYVAVGGTPEEFLARIDEVLARGEGGPRAKRSAAMEAESWDARVEELSAVVARALAGEVVSAHA